MASPTINDLNLLCLLYPIIFFLSLRCIPRTPQKTLLQVVKVAAAAARQLSLLPRPDATLFTAGCGAAAAGSGCRRSVSPGNQPGYGLERSPPQRWPAVAYDVAALALKGPEAELNFPASAASLPAPASSSPHDIQAAAASAAAAAGAARDALRPTRFAQGEGQGQASSERRSEGNASGNVSEFVDEEMIFNMPNVLVNMAEGMLLSPPRLEVDSAPAPENTEDQDLWKFS
ncbi:hypothetical protein NL676_002062 [Syzygium grande]|nr:hypothetical protein NL676_002062 [Syzygium grande]